MSFRILEQCRGHLIVLISAAVLSAVSCEQVEPMPQMSGTCMLGVECMPGNSPDSLVLNLRRLFPLSERYVSAAQKKAPVNASAVLRVNGGEVPLELGSDSLSNASLCCRLELSPGDEIELNVSAPGMPDVSASTVIPVALSDEDILGIEVDRDAFDYRNRDYWKVKLRFRRPSGKRIYYAFSIARPAEYTISGEFCYMLSPGKAPDTLDGVISSSASSSYPYAMFGEYGYDIVRAGSSVLLPDKFFGDGEVCELEAYAGPFSDAAPDKCRIYVYSLSEELFKSVSAAFAYKDNALQSWGVTSPAAVYSNVSGGAGYLGGISLYKSKWINLR